METSAAHGAPIPPVPPMIANDLRFTTWFDRATPDVPEDLAPYLKGNHVYATKQVPSVLALRGTRNVTLKAKADVAVRNGIALQYYSLGPKGGKTHSLVPDLTTGLMQHDVKIFDSELREHVIEKSWKEELPPPSDSKFVPKPNCGYRPIYEDPFAIIAARTFVSLSGKEPPETIVWPGDGIRLSDKIPPYCLDPDIAGRTLKNTCRFFEIPQAAQKMHLLLEHTFWGRKLRDLCSIRYDQSDGTKAQKKERAATVRSWASGLVQRLNHFLQGLGDPLWSVKSRKSIYVDQKPRSTQHRAKRLIELLKTVDGIFVQRYMSVPEERWTWHRYDLFTLKNLSALIGDEFFDGEVAVGYHQVTTRYSQLKKLRKSFKDLSNREQLVSFLSDKEQVQSSVPRWLNDWLPVWRYTRSFEKPFALAQVDGLLSQTRAAGTPPDIVKMQSKRKFISTVSEKPSDLTDTDKALIRAALAKFDETVDPSIFTGLDTKARVTLTISSCWEKTQEEGGTIQAISEIVHMGAIGKKVPKRDLFSGSVVGEVEYSSEDTGTYIFWACLDEVLKASPDEINMAALVMVSEPGKARTVTKATAALKIVLDVVNKICSWPLTKIESSSSGMARASHAWNSFKKSFTSSGKDISFDPLREEVVTGPSGERIKTTTYRDVFMSSTDYENATDAMHHGVASMISRYWMKRCGIPPILQMIVQRTCYRPRPIVFEARGPMAAYGEPWDKESPFSNPHYIMLRKGVLMGDPLTKPVLHLVNILVRTVGMHYSDPSFQEKIFGFSGTTVSKVVKSMLQSGVPNPVLQMFGSPSTSEKSEPSEKMGPLAALLEEYPVDPTIVDPVVSLPESTSHNVHQVDGQRVVEINPTLTWDWLAGPGQQKLAVQTDPSAVVQPALTRTLSFKSSAVRAALGEDEHRHQMAIAFGKQRLEEKRLKEIFRDIRFIPLPPAIPQNVGYREYRARATADGRRASASAIRHAQHDGETVSCTNGLLRLFGIMPW